MNEKLETVLDMYKKGEVTDYVMERELAEALGERISIKIAKDSKNTQATSYCVFPFPEFLVEGFHITYYFDEDALKTIYNTKQLITLVARLRMREQDILRKFNAFLLECGKREISQNYYIGFLLSLYDMIRPELIFDGNEDFLPESSIVLKEIDRFTLEDANDMDIEALLIHEILCPEIIEHVKKKVAKLTDDRISIKVIRGPLEREIPALNIGQQEIVQHVTSTYGTRSHTEVAYDYLPSTNQ